MATLTDTSADGKLSARYLDDRRGVLLKASFPETILHTFDFEAFSNVNNYFNGGIGSAFSHKLVRATGAHNVTFDANGAAATKTQWCACVFKSSGTPITVDSATVAVVHATSGVATTATFNVSAGQTVVAMVAYDAATADAAGDKVAFTNNKSLTNVEVVERGHKEFGSIEGGVAIAYMHSAGSQTGMTVTATLSGVNATNDDLTLRVFLLTNVDATTPVPDAATEGSSIANTTLLTARSRTVTNGLAIYVASEWGAAGAPAVTETAWTIASGGGTLTQPNTTSPINGARDLKLAWTSLNDHAVKRTLSTLEQVAGGREIRVMLSILTPDTTGPASPPPQPDLRLRVLVRDKNGKVTDNKFLPWPGAATTRNNWFTDFWLASDRTMGSIEIWLDDTGSSTNFQVDNVKIIEKAAPKARFARVTDGGYVRGGHPAEGVMGTVYAFDDELTPGQLTEWYAEPVYDTPWRQNTAYYVGPPTGTVDFTIEDRPATDPSHLIKSLETPGLKLYLMINQKQITKGRQTSFVNKQSTGKPAGGITSAYSLAGEYQLITQTVQELKDLMTILDEAVVFIQPPGRYNRAPFYATVTQYSINDVGKMSDLEKIVVVSFQEVERPDTFGQPNFLENRDYTWLAATYATYNDGALTSQTYDQLGFSGVP